MCPSPSCRTCPAGEVRLSRRWRCTGFASIAAVIALLAPLSACAQAPVDGWKPATAHAISGVSIVDSVDSEPPESPTEAGDAAAVPAVQKPVVWTAEQLGLVGGRLRNDALPLAARFVYIPGVPAFNEHVNALLWSAINATGVGYAPQVHGVDAGLADRGCVPGSANWPAADVLSRPETGPMGGAGTSVTCELTGASGTTISIALRVVTGTADAVTSDDVQRLMVDVQGGTVSNLGDFWTEEASADLWIRAIDLLRQRSGGMSSAPIEAPDDAQLALARLGLDSAVPLDGGRLEISLPAGIFAPELEGLGAAPTAEPLVLIAETQTVREWSTPQHLAVLDGLGSDAATPFSGVTAAPTSVPIDCALIPCVALTYDDGPSGYTAQLLDTLASLQASVTFYMVGGYAQGNPDLVARAAAEGHELGSHTMNHPDLTMVSLAESRAQVVGAAEILRQISGQPVTTFRPPYGAINQVVIDAVGMPAILWSVDTNDWRLPGIDALYERAVGGASPGGIVLFHDTHADSVNAAEGVIEGLRNRGFEPVTVTELFGGSVPLGRVSAR